MNMSEDGDPGFSRLTTFSDEPQVDSSVQCVDVNECHSDASYIGSPQHHQSSSFVQRYFIFIKTSWLFVETISLLKLGVPVLLAVLTQQTLFTISLLFVGHVTQRSLELDSAALGISFVNVSGMALIFGLGSGADTMCSQAYGFKNYKRVGIILQRGILILAVAAMPVLMIWLNTESILLLLQQDPCVAKLSGEYVQVFALSLPGTIVLIMVEKYLQAQSVVWIFVLVGILINIMSAVLHAVFLFGVKLGVVGAALSLTISSTCVPVLLVIYIWARGLHKLTWGGWSWASLKEWSQYLKLGLGGFAMIACEWWSFEISVLVTGSIDKTQLAINSVIIQLLSVLFMLPYGMGTAAGIRVGNELGAGNPLRAKRASFTAVGLMAIMGTVLLVLFAVLRRQLSFIFTSISEVADGVENAMLGALGVVFLDQIQGTVSGILRGSGRQWTGAIVNFVFYYLVGLPLGISLAIPVKMGALGMWIGLSVGNVFQTTTLTIILLKTNWKKLSEVAIMNAKDIDKSFAGDKDDNASVDSDDVAMDSPVSTEDYKDEEDSFSLNNAVEEVPLVSSDASDYESQESSSKRSHVTLKPKIKLLVFKGIFFLVGVLLIIVGGVLSQYHPCEVAATVACSNCSSSCCDSCLFSNNSMCLLEPVSSIIQPTPTTLMTSFKPNSFAIVSKTPSM